MPLELMRFDVAIAHDGLDLEKALEAGEGNGYELVRVTVLHADQLVAEQAAPRYGLQPLKEDTAQSMAWATLWVWCALQRMGIQVPAFPPFKGRIIELAKVKPVADPTDTTPDTDPDLLALDPTGPGPDTGSP